MVPLDNLVALSETRAAGDQPLQHVRSAEIDGSPAEGKAPAGAGEHGAALQQIKLPG